MIFSFLSVVEISITDSDPTSTGAPFPGHLGVLGMSSWKFSEIISGESSMSRIFAVQISRFYDRLIEICMRNYFRGLWDCDNWGGYLCFSIFDRVLGSHRLICLVDLFELLVHSIRFHHGLHHLHHVIPIFFIYGQRGGCTVLAGIPSCFLPYLASSWPS